MKREALKILDVKVDGMLLTEALTGIEQFIQERGLHQVCVVNVWSTVLMQKDPEFLAVNNSAALSVADGMPLTWVSRWFGPPIPERISGSDLFHACNTLAAEKGYRVFLLGATPETLEVLSDKLRAAYPGLCIAGTYAPPFSQSFSEEENHKILNAVNTARPDLLWVGLSAPKQEKWIWDNKDSLNVPVAVGVGAVFDFFAGNIKRAPVWMQKIGIEWLHRLTHEPARLWKRYLIGNPAFVWYILKYFSKRLFR
jgi:N-acetylglucosaminyldiphosphoundecaprenol N-acetyl-beta-D-mannosaminyltransferase